MAIYPHWWRTMKAKAQSRGGGVEIAGYGGSRIKSQLRSGASRLGAMRLPPIINNQTRTPFQLPGNLASKLLSPSKLRGRPSASGFQPTMTNPQRTRPNFGIKPLAQVGKPRKSISEMDALSCWNTPDARGPRLEANLRYSTKSRCQKCLGKAVWKCMLAVIGISP